MWNIEDTNIIEEIEEIDLSIDSLTITEEQLNNLESEVTKIYSECEALEKTLGDLDDNELSSSIKLLKTFFDRFFGISNKLGEYEEYVEKKDISGTNRKMKEKIEEITAERKQVQGTLKKIDDIIIESRFALTFLKEPDKIAELQSTIKEIEEMRPEVEWRKQYLESFKKLIESFRPLLYDSLWFDWSDAEIQRSFKDYERFVKKYEYDFKQLQKYGEKIRFLWEKIKGIVDRLNNGRNGEDKLGWCDVANLVTTLKDGKNIPKELQEVFDELKNNNVDNDRLRVILQKIYDGGKFVKERFICDWVWKYNLPITSAELESILGKVFIIEREEEWWDSNDDWEIRDEENISEGVNGRLVDLRNQDLRNLENLYNKLNKGEDSEEYYCCFFGILKKYLFLEITDEETLIKQFKVFEKHKYFHKDIIYVWNGIIERNMKPVIITKKANCARTWKVIKFPTGLHSKVRIIITDDDKIVGLYSHADYIRYFWWSRER